MNENKIPLNELVKTEAWGKFIRKMELYASILIGVIVLLILLGYTTNDNFRLLLIVTLGSSATTCFFIGLNSFKSDSEILSNLFYKIHGFGLSLGFVTLLFITIGWPYPKEIMIILSISLIVISLLLGIREKNGENKNNIDWRYFLRIFVALVPLIYLTIQNFN